MMMRVSALPSLPLQQIRNESRLYSSLVKAGDALGVVSPPSALLFSCPWIL